MYFDSAATTNIHPEVLDAMMPYLTDNYGNASSHHTLGEISRKAIENAREIVATSIGANPDEIYFTSGGSESNNWAIKGLKNRYNIRGSHIISSNIEHHSITESLKYRWNEIEDIAYTLVPVESDGVMDPEKIADNFKLNTRLCSIQHVNNELGTIQPIEKIAAKCFDNGVLFHTDAVQSFGHLPIDVKDMNINLLSASGHKIGCMKGIGFLYISRDCKNQYNSFIHGGAQENGMRASTENVAGIVGLGKAVEIAVEHMKENDTHERKIRDLILVKINQYDGVHINGKIEYMDPRHLNIRVDRCRGEELLALFNEEGIYLSSGSACNSGSGQPSHVLKAIGLSDDQANSSIRISIGSNTSEEEALYFTECLKQNIEMLRSLL